MRKAQDMCELQSFPAVCVLQIQVQLIELREKCCLETSEIFSRFGGQAYGFKNYLEIFINNSGPILGPLTLFNC